MCIYSGSAEGEQANDDQFSGTDSEDSHAEAPEGEDSDAEPQEGGDDKTDEEDDESLEEMLECLYMDPDTEDEAEEEGLIARVDRRTLQLLRAQRDAMRL